MTNLFTYLSNGKLKYICALVMLLCLGVGNVWAGTDSKTETFEDQSAAGENPNYKTETSYNAASSVAGIAWYVEYGLVATTNAISSQSMNIRAYYSSGSASSTWNNPLPYLESKTAITGLQSISFNAKRSGGNTLKIDVQYSTNGSTWNYMKTTAATPADASAQTISTDGSVTYTYNVPSSSASTGYYIKISVNSGSTHSNNPSKNGNMQCIIDNIAFTWTAYTVTYDDNGKTSGSVPTDATKYLSGATVTVKGNTGSLAKTGYDFSGWNTKADGTGADKAASATFTITQDTTLYAKWTATASCTANPSIGTASLNGSISLSSFPVQTTGWTVGSNCEWSDFGFVWSTSVSTPTLESNGTASTNCTKIQKATSGTATSTSHSITGTFSVGATYYVRGYGKNRYASGTYQYTSVMTITPRSITFNSNGGSSVSTIYVNSGTAASAPTAPTKTGYTFGGWYTDNGTFESAVNWSSTISENKTYYAKWTAKQCTISFDIEGGTGTITNVTATYGQAMPSKESNLPTKTGYNFGGFWDGDGGTGTQYYNADGTSKINWNKDVTATQTLYAKWTVKNYTVTWKVNGEDYTTGTPTDNVNHGSHVTTLPTAPSTASYCGDKFMGWTDATDGAYVHGTSNLYTKASDFPAAEGAQTFYAVFADYDE